MVLDIDSAPLRSRSDTAEPRRPRSLDLALRRMGFRPSDTHDVAGAIASGGWRFRTGDDPAPDWHPL